MPRHRNSDSNNSRDADDDLETRSLSSSSCSTAKVENCESSASQTNPRCDNAICSYRMRRMQSFYAARQLCDVCIRCGDREIWAHRVVLAAACEYFERMFNGGMIEAKQRDVRIQDIEPAALEALVSYCYNGQLRLDKNNVEGLLSGGCLLRLDDVIERCSAFVRSQMDPSNCLGIRSFADAQGCIKLHQSAHAYTTDHFLEVAQQTEFLALSLQDIVSLLSSDELNVSSEKDVYDAAMAWLKHDSPNRRQYAGRLLAVIRLPFLPPEFLADNVDTNSLFRDDPECQTLVKDAMKFHLLPDRRVLLHLGDRAKPRKSTVGTLYVVGGMDIQKGALTIERYDNLKNEWHEVSRMSARRLQLGVAVLEGKIHLVGGRDGLKTLNTFESWEPSTNTWAQLPSLNTPRHGLGVAVLEDVIYAIGGHDGWSYLSTAERYDSSTRCWMYIGEMSTARNTVGVAVLNGKIYAIGGRDSGQCLRTMECYSPHTNKWTQCPQMIKRRGFVGVSTLHGYIYAVGGLDTPACNPSATRLSCIERYDPKTDSWSIVANLSVGRDGIGVCPLGNLLFAVGGYSGSAYVQAVECYDPVTNECRKVASLNGGRAAAGVTVVPRCQQVQQQQQSDVVNERVFANQ